MQTVETFLLANSASVYTTLLLVTLGVVALWEHAAPRRPLSADLGVRWSGNFFLFFLNGGLLWLVYTSLGVGASVAASERGWGLLQQVSALPPWVEFVVALLLMDLGHYLIHRAFHQIPLLWRVHRLHHTDPDFDFTTGSRFHPFEAVLEHGANLAVVALVGPPVLAVLLFTLTYAVTSTLVHGNIRLPAGWDRATRLLFVTPDMHRTHHSQIERETNSNYGGLFTFWDRILGSYVDEPEGGHERMKIGLREYSDVRHIRLGPMLRNPFLASPPDHSSEEVLGREPRSS